MHEVSSPASEHPFITIVIVSWRPIRKASLVFFVSLVPVVVATIRRTQLLMRDRTQVIFNLVHIPLVETPVVISQLVKTGEAVALNATSHVNVGIEIAPNQLSQVAEHWPASMQTKV